jgi:serine/threonine protein kinase
VCPSFNCLVCSSFLPCFLFLQLVGFSWLICAFHLWQHGFSSNFIDLDIGRVLGRGGFGVVSEITKIKLVDHVSIATHGAVACQRRAQLEEASADGKFVIKRLHDKSRENPSIFARAVVDLALEARFLSVLRHPHILTLRGVAATDPYDGKFFLVLDRLYEILSERLQTWKKKQPSRLMDRTGKKKRCLYIDRCQVAYDICCAVKYLHSLK